jgi:hypothetical protein
VTPLRSQPGRARLTSVDTRFCPRQTKRAVPALDLRGPAGPLCSTSQRLYLPTSQRRPSSAPHAPRDHSRNRIG